MTTASDLPVVLLSGPRADDVMASVEKWRAADLVGESVWVLLDDVVEEDGGITRVPAVMFGADGVEPGELFEFIGTRRLELLRLVGAQLVAEGAAPGPAEMGRARLIAEMLRMALPLAVNADDAGTRVLRVNLLVPESSAEGLPTDHLIPSWDVNAVVAAEDRPDLDRGNVFVRTQNFAPHAAAAIASVGGMWAGVPEGALDHMEPDSTGADRDVVVVRTSVRILVGDGPSSRVLRQAMAMLQADEVGPAPLLPWALPAADPLAITRRAATHLMRHGDWRDARPAPAPVVMPPLRDVDRKSVAGGGGTARGLLRLGIAALRGKDASIDSAPPGSPVATGALAAEKLAESEQALATDLRTLEDRGVAAPDPQTWHDLRQMCFSLVDGGELPDGFAEPRSGGLRELLPAWAVTPDPEDLIFPVGRPDARVVRDPMAARTMLAEGDKAAEMQEWVERRRRSLTWRMAEQLGHRMKELAAEAVGDRRREPGTQAPDLAPLEAEHRRFRMGWRVCLGLLVLVGVLGAVGAAAGAWLVPPVLLAGGGVALIAVLVFVSESYFRSLVRYEREVEHQIAARRANLEARAAARREGARLAMLYTGLTDWAEILGRVLHHPWCAGSRELSLPEEVVDSLPASVAVAVPTSRDTARERRLATFAVPIVCTPGWTSSGFRCLVESLEGALAGWGDLIAADLDVHDGPLSARRTLLEACQDGAAGVLLPGTAVERVEDAVAEGLLDAPQTRVERTGRFADGARLRDTEFYSGTTEASAPL